MRLTVLGGCGAFPAAGQACSGYLLEHDGFRLLIDPGYAIVPRLLEVVTAESVNAVFVSHGHPDHCADLNPLLRARNFGDSPAVALPIYALPGALDAVLALDGNMLDGTHTVHEFQAGRRFGIGPFEADTRLLPHWVPNAGVRLSAGDQTIMYTGDSGPSQDVIELARDADLLLAEATYPDQLPDGFKGNLTSAREAGQQATQAGARRLLLTHLWPGVEAQAAMDAARAEYEGEIAVAAAGLVVDLT
jgi:ribonuclease BN (tRNA processing enzyme)